MPSASSLSELIAQHSPDALVVNCTSDDGHVMGFRHATLPIHGVQFHPESVLTPLGCRMMENWLGVPTGSGV